MLLLSDLLDIAISVGSSVSVEAHWTQETGIIQSDQDHHPVTSDEHHLIITGHHYTPQKFWVSDRNLTSMIFAEKSS